MKKYEGWLNISKENERPLYTKMFRNGQMVVEQLSSDKFLCKGKKFTIFKMKGGSYCIPFQKFTQMISKKICGNFKEAVQECYRLKEC